MAASRSLCLSFLESLILLGYLLTCTPIGADATTWNVGDSQGWTTMDYAQWTSGKDFKQGDIVYFSYAQGAHDVVEVSEADFRSCAGRSPIRRWMDGNTSVILEKAGARIYFICSFEGHCPPMQLSLAVHPASASSARSPSIPYLFSLLSITAASI